jgi:hypothetical protein
VVVEAETSAVVVEARLAMATTVQVPGPLQLTPTTDPSEAGTTVDSHLDPPSTVHSTPLPESPMPATAQRVVETHEIDDSGRPPGAIDNKPLATVEKVLPASWDLRILEPAMAKQVVTEGQASP